MKKIYLLLLIPFILFTGCLEITQKIKFKKNGSGSVEFTVDFSKMKSLMKDEMENIGKDSPFNKETKSLAVINGISKVKKKKKDGIETLSFSFKNVEALNTALGVVWSDASKKPAFVMKDDQWEFNPIYFGSFSDIMSGNQKKSKDTEHQDIEGGGDVVEDYSEGLKSKKDNEMKEGFEMLKTMFGEPKLNFEIEFVRTIASVSDNQAQVLNNGKKIVRSYSLFDASETSPLILKFK